MLVHLDDQVGNRDVGARIIHDGQLRIYLAENVPIGGRRILFGPPVESTGRERLAPLLLSGHLCGQELPLLAEGTVGRSTVARNTATDFGPYHTGLIRLGDVMKQETQIHPVMIILGTADWQQTLPYQTIDLGQLLRANLSATDSETADLHHVTGGDGRGGRCCTSNKRNRIVIWVKNACTPDWLGGSEHTRRLCPHPVGTLPPALKKLRPLHFGARRTCTKCQLSGFIMMEPQTEKFDETERGRVSGILTFQMVGRQRIRRVVFLRNLRRVDVGHLVPRLIGLTGAI